MKISRMMLMLMGVMFISSVALHATMTTLPSAPAVTSAMEAFNKAVDLVGPDPVDILGWFYAAIVAELRAMVQVVGDNCRVAEELIKQGPEPLDIFRAFHAKKLAVMGKACVLQRSMGGAVPGEIELKPTSPELSPLTLPPLVSETSKIPDLFRTRR
ncbi:MAG: hypothetical protein JW725_01170 [Candidatus Babeliaceae bacterium]|nr:hypothetical protein [Candidatus Babeliaceae bacterium]